MTFDEAANRMRAVMVSLNLQPIDRARLNRWFGDMVDAHNDEVYELRSKLAGEGEADKER